MVIDFRARAAANLQTSIANANAALDTMMADHAARGLLQSGNTIRAAMRIFEEQTATALDQTLEEVANRISHRGRAWNSAMRAVGEALTEHLSGARQCIGKALKVADRKGSESVARAVDVELAQIGIRMRDRLVEFREGWTAPAPLKWKDRRPLAYAVMLLVIGAVLGVGGSLATDWTKSRIGWDSTTRK